MAEQEQAAPHLEAGEVVVLPPLVRLAQVAVTEEMVLRQQLQAFLYFMVVVAEAE